MSHSKNASKTSVDNEKVAVETVGEEAALLAAAKQGNEAERSMSLRESLRLYPKAVAYSLLLSTAIVMEGFDLVLIGNLFGQPQFVQKYGQPDGKGGYNLSSAWQAGLKNATQVGSICGLFLGGFLSDKIGYRRTMMIALSAITLFIFILFFAPNVQTLVVGEILCGIPWGVFQSITTAYASEIVPTQLRPYLTTYVNLCWVFGQLIASGVLRGTLDVHDQWAYRIPFALQWIWPVPILVGVVFFLPESPWYLVRHGREDEARIVLRKLTSPKHTAYNMEAHLALMKYTNLMEAKVSAGTSFLDCFKGVDRRRTEIAMVIWSIQSVSGSTLIGYSTYFLVQAGMSEKNSFNITIVQCAIGVFGVLTAWAVIPRVGRRTLFLWGLVSAIISLSIIGGLGFAVKKNPNVNWGVAALLLIFTYFFDFTVGPITYSLVSELSSTRLRAKTVALARNAYNICEIVQNIYFTKMINSDGLNWGSKAGFWLAGAAALAFVYAFFRLPEPKGRTYSELNVLFEQGVPARKFSSTHVELTEKTDDDEILAPKGGH